MFEKKYLMWDDGNGNSVIIQKNNMRDIYFKSSDKSTNGGDPDKYFQARFVGGMFSANIVASFDNPHNPLIVSEKEIYPRDGKLIKVGDSLCLLIGNFDANIFHSYKVIDSLPEFIPLPEIRKRNYLLSNKDICIYVSYDKYMTDYDTHKFFIGNADNMKQIPILDIIRYRDGGTTIIKTELGTLHVPTPFTKGQKDYVIKFNDEVLVELDQDVEVEEIGDKARIIFDD